MEMLTVWYLIIGAAYSLLTAWRCGSSNQALWRDIRDCAISFLFWPWTMITVERYFGRR